MSFCSRRSFLRLIGAGGLGLAGWLTPARALAWRHHRRCSAPPADCLPEPVCAPESFPIQVPLTIGIDYPRNGNQVPGGGNFCIWGPDPKTGGLTAKVTWGTSGSANGTLMGSPPTNKYAFSFSGLPINTSLSLVVKDGAGNTSSTVTFSCI